MIIVTVMKTMMMMMMILLESGEEQICNIYLALWVELRFVAEGGGDRR
jgi:hypothetical protein